MDTIGTYEAKTHLAARLGVPLATLDASLVEAAESEGVAVLAR